MRRRHFLTMSACAAASSALARPAISRTERSRTLVVVPENNLTTLDPVASTTLASNAHGYCVFDTLYGVDDQLRPSPQMAAGHEIADDGKRWTITLRPELWFHDGEPVRAADCVASLVRWGRRDTYGQSLAAIVDQWSALDDRRIEIRLKQPFAALPRALSHYTAVAAFMMPERLAKTDPFKSITEAVGSGPFRFLADEYLSGDRVAYAKFDRYVPRSEPAQGTSGGKRVHFDRLEWRVIPDAATVAAALIAGEVDWWQLPQTDVIPMLARDRNIAVKVSDPIGNLAIIRFNCVVPPFNNPALRRVVASAVSQADYMHAIAGDDRSGWRTCYAMFPCGLPGVHEVGAALMSGPKDMQQLRAAVQEAGYQGEKVVILQATDTPTMSAACEVTADLLTRLGMRVDLQAMDFGTVLARRAKKDTVENGGWSIFNTYAPAATIADPGLNFALRGNGARGFPGWYESAKMETLAQQWLQASDEPTQFGVLDRMQEVAFEGPGSVPLGLYFPRTAYRSNLNGVLPGTNLIPWNVERA